MLLDEIVHLSAAIALSRLQVWLTWTRSQLDKRLENKIESQAFFSVIFFQVLFWWKTKFVHKNFVVELDVDCAFGIVSQHQSPKICKIKIITTT